MPNSRNFFDVKKYLGTVSKTSGEVIPGLAMRRDFWSALSSKGWRGDGPEGFMKLGCGVSFFIQTNLGPADTSSETLRLFYLGPYFVLWGRGDSGRERLDSDIKSLKKRQPAIPRALSLSKNLRSGDRREFEQTKMNSVGV